MNDFALQDNPKLSSLVFLLRQEGYIINIKRLGPNYGPGFVTEHAEIVLNNWYLRGKVSEYSEDRLIIVLLHELGHIKYQANVPTDKRDQADSEYSAFENSINGATALAKKGDTGPLDVVLHYLQQRQQSGEEPDYYQDALDRIISSSLWNDAQIVANKSLNLIGAENAPPS